VLEIYPGFKWLASEQQPALSLDKKKKTETTYSTRGDVSSRFVCLRHWFKPDIVHTRHNSSHHLAIHVCVMLRWNKYKS